MGGLDRIQDRIDAGELPLKDPDAIALLSEDPGALLLGVLFDQRMRVELAFKGPLVLKQRLGHLDLAKIAAMADEDLHAVFSAKPAIHRFPNMMAKRAIALAAALVEQYGSDPAALWREADNEADFARRVKALPGFGPGKVTTLAHALDVFGYRD